MASKKTFCSSAFKAWYAPSADCFFAKKVELLFPESKINRSAEILALLDKVELVTALE